MTENDFRNRIIESDLTANARLVCYVLLQFRNRKSGDCYPSQVTLSDACGLCRNTVSRAVRELEAHGYVSTEKKRLRGQKFTSLFYCFDIQKSTQCSTDEQSNDVSIDVSNDVATDEHKPIEPIEPIKSITPTNNKGNGDVLVLAVERYNDMAGRAGLPKCQILNDTRKKKLRVRLQECDGLEGWYVALKKVEESRFLTGKKIDWKADFDFILQKQSFTKLMEGSYDDNTKAIAKSKSDRAKEALMRGRTMSSGM